MVNGMKFKRVILPTILAILVISSITLSSLIVFRPVYIFSNGNHTKNQHNPTNDILVTNTTLNAEDVFMPSFYITYVNDEIQYSANPEILEKVTDNMENTCFDLTKQSILNQYDYEQLVFKESAAELLFDAPISFGVVESYFKEVPEEFIEDVFTRIAFSSVDSTRVYFINDATRQIYLAKTSLNDSSWFESFYDAEEFKKIQSYVTKEGLTFIPTEALTLPKEVYLVEQSPTSYFIGELFPDTNELRNRSDGAAIVYNDTLSQLKIDRTTRVLTYFRNQPITDELEMTKSLQQSFYELRRFEDWDLGLRYSGYSAEKHTVDFTRYIDSIPILGSGGFGNVQLSVTKDGISQMRLSTLVAKTLITKREEMVSLTSGKAIVDLLLSKGLALTDIESIRIGYEWQASEESNRLATFEPKWFVKVDGSWHSVEAYIKDLANANASLVALEMVNGGVDSGF